VGRARLPTLMLAAAANATATPAPASHRRLANGFSRLAFRYPARDMGVAGCRMVSGLSNASGSRMILARGRQAKSENCWLVAALLAWIHWPSAKTRQRASPSFRSGTPQCSARRSVWLGTLPGWAAGLASLRPLHSLPHPLHRLRGTLSLIPSVSNLTRPARPRRCAPRAARTVVALPVLADRARALRGKQAWPRDFVRPRHQHYGARRCLSPRTKAIAPQGFARCKASALSARPASFTSLRKLR
jgi:hypothetical protein